MALQIGKLIFGDIDKDGDVEVEMDNENGSSIYMFITKQQMKDIINHLEEQLLK